MRHEETLTIAAQPVSGPARFGRISAGGTDRSISIRARGVKIPFILAFALPLIAQELEIRDVRHWSLAEVTRVAIEASGEFEYRHERLSNPDRVFFDITGARPKIAGRRLHSVEVGDRFLKRIRVAEPARGITRVVFDLEAGVLYTASELANPNRLVVELRAPVPPGEVSSAQPARPAHKAPAHAPPAPIAAVPAGLRPGPALLPASATPVAPVRLLAAAPALREPAYTSFPRVRLPEPFEPPRIEIARGARQMSHGPSSLTRALGLKVARVVLDPGHGGHDTGAVGPNGLSEKELVLDVALRLGKLIEERLEAEVIYTRTGDAFVPLEERTQMANERRADLFLSLHANSSSLPRAGGVETYYLNLTNSRQALELAARENAGAQKSVHELGSLVQKIALNDKAEESREFAGRVQAALHSFATRSNPAARNRGVKKAPFFVLIGATMPSVLAEIGFLSNPKEEALLRRPEHRQRLAEALYQGVARYARDLSHFQVAGRIR